MKKIKKVLLTALFVSTAFFFNAQSTFTWTCGNEATSAAFTPTDIAKALYADSIYQSQTFTNTLSILPNPPATYVIPVVVHVLYNAPSQNLSYNQILWQIQALNIAFQKLYPAYNGQPNGINAVNTQIQFCLAQNTFPSSVNWTNPCEPGVMRYPVSPTDMNFQNTAVGQNTLMALAGTPVNFPHIRYLNIYLVNAISGNPTTAVGMWPWIVSASNPLDGVVITNDMFGDNTIPGNNFSLNPFVQEGKILAHEVGHYLGLYHTFEISFGGTCSGNTFGNCTTGGDLICDTPADNAVFTTCNASSNSCIDVMPGDPLDMPENFMDYELDVCYNTFTSGQATKMWQVLSTTYASFGRQDMTLPANLAVTGLTNAASCCPNGPVTAYFTHTLVAPCSLTANFTNLIPVTCNASITYTWNFGDSNTSNSINPSHTYASAGDYTVTCTTQNAGCTSVSYTVPITIGFSPSFVGVTSPTICAGQHQNMKFQINGTKPYNVSYSNGVTSGAFTSTLTQLEITVPTPTNITGPTNQSYTVIIGVGSPCPQTFVVNFSVVNCCSELITNGNFNNLNTGVSSDLIYAFPSVPTQTPNYYDISNNVPISTHWPLTITNSAPPFGNFMVADSYSFAQHPGSETWLYYQNITPAPSTWYSVNALIIAGHPLTGPPYNPLQEIVTVEVIDNANVVVGSINNYVMNFNNYQFWRNFQFNFQTGASPNLPYKLRIKQVQNFGVEDGYDFIIDEVSVKAFSAPSNVLNVTASTTLACLGGTVQLTSSPAGGSPQYYWSASTGTTTCSPCNPTFATPTITTVYTVQALAPNGCLSVGTKTVNVLNIAYTPTVSTASQTICAGSSATISAGALGYPANLFNFFWSPPAGTGNTVTVSPAVTTNYTVSICDKSLCTPCKTITTQVVVIPFGTFTVSPTNTTICKGTSVQLNTTTLPFYTWTPSSSLSCANCQNPIATPTANTIYTVTATNASGCTKAFTATVNVIPSPTVLISQSVVCSGVTTTLVASGASTYTWWPGNTTGPTLTVNITSPLVITIIGAGANGCKTTLVTTITPVAPPTISATSASICPGTNATLTASGASSFTWSPGPLTGTSVVVSPPASQVYTVIGGSGCNSTITTQVIVYPNPTVSVVANPALGICVPGQTVSLTGSGAGTYTFTNGSNTFFTNPAVFTPTSSSIYTVSLVNSVGCSPPNVTVAVNVSSVCACTVPSPTNILPATLSGTTLLGGSYAINNNLTITSGTVLFSTAEFLIAPNVTITVNSGAKFETFKAHLYSCYDMWQGIVVQNGAMIEMGQGTLIEDAVNAVDITNYSASTPTIALISGAVFNRNLDAITINNYPVTSASYPFIISDNVFTSRQFTFTPTSWPFTGFLKAACTLTSSLASPYCLQGFPFANLKTPNNGLSSRIGISLNAVGLLANPTNTATVTYNEIFIGDSLDKQKENVFDNLGVGINATASSLRATGNVFQNGRVVSGFQASGIRSISGSFEQTHLRVFTLVNSLGKVIRNEFYDVYFGIQVSNTFITDIYGNHFFSTQQKSGYNSIAFYAGKFGVNIVTNRFMALNVSDNKIFNHTNPISLTGNYTNLTLGAFSGVAQYVGRINIDRNNIKATNAGIITTEYVSNAITLQQPLLPPPGATTFSTDTRLSITDNNIKDVYRGVFMQNWHNGQHPNVVTNTITLEGDLITGSVRQYGVSGVQCTSLSIYSNEVKGNASLTNTISTGIYTSVNNNLSVTCNTVRAIYQGFEFAGSQPVNTTWKGNFMRNNSRGFVLSNNGIIGTQGSATVAIDNQWMGGWAGNFHTYCISSLAANSPIYTRTVAPFYPTLNSGNFVPQSYFGGWVFPASGPSYSCTAPPSIAPPGGGGDPTLDMIAQDSVAFVTVIPESQFIHKNHLFRRLKHDPSLMSSDIVLQNFYNSSLSGCREKMSNIETNLSNGNKAVAASQLSTFTPANNIEINYKKFFEIYKSYYDSTYNSNDSLNLTALANKCPFIDGSVVYQARAMYNMVYSTVELFNDNCPVEENIDTRFMMPQTVEQSNPLSKWAVELYPNPATNDLFITGSNSDEDIQVFIADVSGKIVANYLVKTQAFTGKLKLDLNSGIYFVTLVNQSNDRIVKKLIISK